MDRRFFIVADGTWLVDAESNPKRLERQRLCPIGPKSGHLAVKCNLLVKCRHPSQGLVTDDSARLEEVKDTFFVKSDLLCTDIESQELHKMLVVFFFEGTPDEARCVVYLTPHSLLTDLERARPTLRLASFDLPPRTATIVENPDIVADLYRTTSERDPELFGVNASRFLSGPHILAPLFAHIMSLRSEDNMAFLIQLKKVAEQLRRLLLDAGAVTRIEKIARSHLDLWAEVDGWRIAFLDGGVARIPSLARMEPMALRVGVYSVQPGNRDRDSREQWSMSPFVVADLLARNQVLAGETDRRRLLEAARYVLEPLVALAHVQDHTATKALFLHGPLVNQFLTYDEGEPNNIPCLDPAFLSTYGITRETVEHDIQDIPSDPSGTRLWNQFMAIYAHLMRAVFRTPTPIAGVVENVAGRSLSHALLESLREERIINEAYVRRIKAILDRFDIGDEFLFGCVLEDGEFVTPMAIQKNLATRARDRWQPVVRQYPSPYTTMLKVDQARFPFRVEFNDAARQHQLILLRLLYHTARLLPRYAFPVGLDIADKYARVPDWIAKGVSVEVSAAVLQRAIKTGDPKLVAQVKQLLARTPRDFFYRPGAGL